MARHRDIRNLDLEEVLREDDYDEVPELTFEQEEQMKAGVKAFYAALGPDCGYDQTVVEETLWYYYFDVTETIDYLLNNVAPKKNTSTVKKDKVKPKKDKESTDENTKLTSTSSQINNSGTPFSLSSLLNSSSTISNTGPGVSLSSLSNTTTGTPVSLSSLSDPTAGTPVSLSSLSNPTTGPTVSLSSLSHTTTGPGVSLSSLSNPTTGPAVSLSSLSNPTVGTPGSLSSLSTPATGPTMSLSSLSNPTTGNPVSLSSLSNPTTETPVSLSSLLSHSSLNTGNLATGGSNLPQRNTTLGLNSLGNSPTQKDSSSSMRSSLSNPPASTSLSCLMGSNTNHLPTYSKLSSLANASSKPSSIKLSMLAEMSSLATFSNSGIAHVPGGTGLPSLNSREGTSDSHLVSIQDRIDSKPIDHVQHPMFAPPSELACFLFQQEPTKFQPFAYIDDFNSFSLVLEAAANSSIQPSHFDQPSPDDVVLNAQKQAEKKKAHIKASKSNPSKASKPGTPSGSKSATANPSKQVDQVTLDMEGLNLKIKPKPATTSSPKPASTPKPSNVKKIDVLAEFKTRNSDRSNLNLVVVGHVDAGKSTMMGHLLYQTGVVDSRTIKKFEKDSERMGKKSFAFAWVLDETSEERKRGITVDIATKQFTTKRHNITILDAPGHRDFVPNMISGASQADVAVLVVDATPGEFETGFARGGQTKEHALLIRSLGVRQVAVAINKLDMCNWAQDRFDAICAELGDFLTQAGFQSSTITFVPVSGLQGDNLVAPISDSSHPLKSWYSGPSLLEIIDGFEPQTRAIELPLRLPVADFFRGGLGSTGGVTVSGKIIQGHLQLGDNVAVLPGDATGTIKAIEVNDQTASWAVAGDSVVVTLANLDILELRSGSVLASTIQPALVSNRFLAQVLIFEPPVPITPGYPVILHHQSMNISAYITKLVNLLDRTTGAIQKRNPRHLPKACTATLEIAADTTICLETFATCKDLGRFALRRDGATLATGVILEILPSSSALL